MVNSHRKEYVYSINENQRIDFVNDEWLEFAIENGATNLKKEDVLNKSIWDFIADRDTEHIFDVLFKKIRKEKINVGIPFRCDSPDCRRFMQLEMSSDDDENIQFKSWIVKEEKRPAVELLNMREEKSGEVLRMCSWCKKINTSDDEWHEVEKAVEILELFDDAPLPQFTHTICTACENIFWAKINEKK